MKTKSILIIDDEKNIRLTMDQSLEPLGIPVRTAVNGEEALQKLGDKPAGLVFLDLKMPGMNGMEVLRRIKEKWSETRVIIITAHGTVESAVEAMKLGAVDFIQKPFSPAEIRDLAIRVMEREELDVESSADYPSLVEFTKRCISDREFSAAREAARKAIASEPTHPEAYNLLGVLLEMKGERLEAQKLYRAALDMDPTFKSAWTNLGRTTSWHNLEKIDLGPDEKEAKPGKEGVEETDEK